MRNTVTSGRVMSGIFVYGLGGFREDDTAVVGEAPEVLTKRPGDLKSQTIL